MKEKRLKINQNDKNSSFLGDKNYKNLCFYDFL